MAQSNPSTPTQSRKEINSPPLNESSSASSLSSDSMGKRSNSPSSRGSVEFGDSDYDMIDSLHSHLHSSDSSQSISEGRSGSESNFSATRSERNLKDPMGLSFPDPLDSQTDDDGEGNESGAGELEHSIISDYSFLVDGEGSASVVGLEVTPSLSTSAPPSPTLELATTIERKEDAEPESKKETYQGGNIGKWLETTGSGSRVVRRRSTIKKYSRGTSTASLPVQITIVFIGTISIIDQKLIKEKISKLGFARPIEVVVVEKEQIESKIEVQSSAIIWICEPGKEGEVATFITGLETDSIKRSINSSSTFTTPDSSTLFGSVESTASTSTLRPAVAIKNGGLARSLKSNFKLIYSTTEILELSPATLVQQLNISLASSSSTSSLEVDHSRFESVLAGEPLKSSESSRISSILILAIATLAILAASLLESTPAFLPPPITSLSTAAPSTTIQVSLVSRSTAAAKPEILATQDQFKATSLSSIPTAVAIRNTYAVAVIETKSSSLAIFAKRHLRREVGRFSNETQTEEKIAKDALNSLRARDAERRNASGEEEESDMVEVGIKVMNVMNDLLKQLILVDLEGIKNELKDSWSIIRMQKDGPRVRAAQRGVEKVSKILEENTKKIIEGGLVVGEELQELARESEIKLKEAWNRSIQEAKENILPILIKTYAATPTFQESIDSLVEVSESIAEKTKVNYQSLLEEIPRMESSYRAILEHGTEELKALKNSKRVKSALKGRKKVLNFFKTRF